jgi:hypothetical protein
LENKAQASSNSVDAYIEQGRPPPGNKRLVELIGTAIKNGAKFRQQASPGGRDPLLLEPAPESQRQERVTQDMSQFLNGKVDLPQVWDSLGGER